MENKIVNKKTSNKLVLKGATADMAGSCTCFVKGIGSQDSAEITVEAQGMFVRQETRFTTDHKTLY